jgi:hypothetical protein
MEDNVLTFNDEIKLKFDLSVPDPLDKSLTRNFLDHIFQQCDGDYTAIEKTIINYMSDKKIECRLNSTNKWLPIQDDKICQEEFLMQLYDTYKYYCDMDTFMYMIEKITALEIIKCKCYVCTHKEKTNILLFRTRIQGRFLIFSIAVISIENLEEELSNSKWEPDNITKLLIY